MRILDFYPAKLVVTTDAASRGTEGRIYLQFPEEMLPFVGRKYRSVGILARDDALLLVGSPVGNTITPRRQFWWKNGVRDHNIRVNHHVTLYVLKLELLVVELLQPTGEDPPQLPPRQDVLFEETR